LKTSLPPLSSQVAGARYCFLSRSKGRHGGLRVILAGREECRADYQIFRESYPTNALELVVSGTGVLQLGRQSQRLLPGMVFSYGPGISHGIRAKGPGLIKYFVDFTGDEGDDLAGPRHVGGGPECNGTSSASDRDAGGTHPRSRW